MMDILQTFLRAAAARPFALREWDCGLWLADWVMAATGKPDPAASLRGAYYESGDLVVLVRHFADSAGLAETREPRRGDAGLIVVLGHLVVGAIYSGARWVTLRRDCGLVGITRAPCLNAWRVA